MSDAILKAVQQKQLKSDVPHVRIGDTVEVDVRIVEGSKERIQGFNGTVIAINGSGLNQTITVRRIVANEGVERVFPVHSPRVATIQVKRHGRTRRSKLYYLRDRVGKRRRLQDHRRSLEKGPRILGSSSEGSADASTPEQQA